MKISGIGLIGIMLFTAIIFMVMMMFFERYFSNNSNKQLMRIMIFSLLLNIIILVFLIFSYSKIIFNPGIQGPSGLKGRVGPQGRDSDIAECSPKLEKLGEVKKIFNDEKNMTKLDKPILVD
tara:strand:+ start:201 stop:566 length:366 start_codon:yes stop_codon:yes gene_type:complete